MNNPDILQKQAVVFGRFIVGHRPTATTVELYKKVMTKTAKDDISAGDAKLLRLVVAYPLLVGAVDGGLALVRPQSEVRRRLYTMFAILEATPTYADQFLPKKRSALYAFVIFCVGIRAALRGVFGIMIVKLAGRS